MKTILGLLLFALFLTDTPFHSLNLKDTSGNTVDLSRYKGKRVLLVNTASQSKYSSQLEQLAMLQNTYKDSLAVILFPSNSFGNEPLTGAAFADSIRINNYPLVVAEKSDVTGSTANVVFQWLADKQKNGRLSNTPSDDYQKYLLDKNGMVIGVFASQLNPTDSLIHKTILKSY